MVSFCWCRRCSATRLSAENKRQMFIPRGFAHGFITLTDDVEIQYKADNYYAPECDGGIRWDDPAIGVEWPLRPVVLSEKDVAAPLLSERTDLNFVYEEMAQGKGYAHAGG